MKTILTTLATIIIMVLAGVCWAQSPEEAVGKAAEQEGKYQEALARYVAALQKTPEGSADEQRLLEAAIKATQKIDPAPPIPEEGKRFFIRGQALTKEAKSTADFEKAAREFAKASRIAPWWGDAHYNRGVVLEKAAKYDDAITSYKLYLSASPKSPDAGKVREHIYTVEVLKEKASEEAEARRKLISPEELDKGTWRVRRVWPDGTIAKDGEGKEMTGTCSLHFTGNKGSGEVLFPLSTTKVNGVLSGTSFKGNITNSGYTGTCEGEVRPDGKSILFRWKWPSINEIIQILFDRIDSPLLKP